MGIVDQFTKETVPISLEGEMRKSYLDYAMSVIVGRRLPDALVGTSSMLSAMADRWEAPPKPAYEFAVLDAPDQPLQQTDVGHCPKGCLTLRVGHTARAPPSNGRLQHKLQTKVNQAAQSTKKAPFLLQTVTPNNRDAQVEKRFIINDFWKFQNLGGERGIRTPGRL